MKWLRPGVVALFCAGSTAAALAAEQSLVGQVTGAFTTVVKQATTAATSAADSLSQKSKRKRSARNRKDGDDKPAGEDTESGDEAASAEDEAELPLPVRKPKPWADRQAKAPPKTPVPAPPAVSNAAPADKSGSAKADGKAPSEAAKSATPPVPTEWSALEVELAKARCTQLLKGIDAVAVPEAPVRKGNCGTPAPVRLVSIGKNPEVAISPPALLTCDMVVALHKWVTKDLQPLAKAYLDAPIVKIETMSDYACRMAYGRVGNKLSEHGKVNALDIRGFVTSKARTAYVLEEWGPIKRDVARQIAAKAAAEKAEAERKAAEKKAAEDGAKSASAAEKAQPVADKSGAPALDRTTIIEGMPTSANVAGAEDSRAGTAQRLGSAARRLGGPKPKEGEDGATARAAAKAAEAAISIVPPTRTSRFLHEAHNNACRVFGTTLGPEANDDHRNHFHVDMAERKFAKICD